jgi:hypothetical protein
LLWTGDEAEAELLATALVRTCQARVQSSSLQEHHSSGKRQKQSSLPHSMSQAPPSATNGPFSVEDLHRTTLVDLTGLPSYLPFPSTSPTSSSSSSSSLSCSGPAVWQAVTRAITDHTPRGDRYRIFLVDGESRQSSNDTGCSRHYFLWPRLRRMLRCLATTTTNYAVDTADGEVNAETPSTNKIIKKQTRTTTTTTTTRTTRTQKGLPAKASDKESVVGYIAVNVRDGHVHWIANRPTDDETRKTHIDDEDPSPLLSLFRVDRHEDALLCAAVESRTLLDVAPPPATVSQDGSLASIGDVAEAVRRQRRLNLSSLEGHNRAASEASFRISLGSVGCGVGDRARIVSGCEPGDSSALSRSEDAGPDDALIDDCAALATPSADSVSPSPVLLRDSAAAKVIAPPAVAPQNKHSLDGGWFIVSIVVGCLVCSLFLRCCCCQQERDSTHRNDSAGDLTAKATRRLRARFKGASRRLLLAGSDSS